LKVTETTFESGRNHFVKAINCVYQLPKVRLRQWRNSYSTAFTALYAILYFHSFSFSFFIPSSLLVPFFFTPS
jgi:hypothetical protein